MNIKSLSDAASPEKVENVANAEKVTPKKKTPKKSESDSLPGMSSVDESPAVSYDKYTYDATIMKTESSSKLHNIDANQVR